MEFTQKALITKVGRFKEADMWVRFLTPGRGLLTAFAFGGARSRRRFCGCLDPFNVIEARIVSSRGGRYFQLQEARLLERHGRIRADAKRLGAAVNCLKFAEAVHEDTQSDPGAFDLLQLVLGLLEEREDHFASLPLLFRAGLTFSMGYRPDFETCHVCGLGLHDMALPHFEVERGRVVCGTCRTTSGRTLRTGREALETLAGLARNDPRRWPDLEASPELRRDCVRIIDAFVEYHLGFVWDRGAFRRP